MLLVLGAAAAALEACGGGGKNGDAVLKAAPVKPSFGRHEPVRLNLTVSNAGHAPIAASASVQGTVLVVSLERNGQPVVPRHSFLKTEESLAVLVGSQLRKVPSGRSLALSYTSNFDQGAGGQALYSVRPGRLSNPLDVYSVTAPGRYVLKLQDQYLAGAKSSSSAFTGPTNTATVAFDVTH
jgi:hypothetical protein